VQHLIVTQLRRRYGFDYANKPEWNRRTGTPFAAIDFRLLPITQTPDRRTGWPATARQTRKLNQLLFAPATVTGKRHGGNQDTDLLYGAAHFGAQRQRLALLIYLG